MNDGLSQGSLAVDGNKVFMATHDGKVWMYEDTSLISRLKDITQENILFTIFPNPSSDFIEIKFSAKEIESAVDQVQIYNVIGQQVMKLSDFVEILPRMDISSLSPGIYTIRLSAAGKNMETARFFKR